MESRIPRVMLRVCLLPLAGYLIAVGLAAYSSSLHGHWPVHDQPDPKRLPHQWIVAPLGLFSILSCALVLIIPAALGVAHVVLHRKKVPHMLLGAWAVYLAGAAVWSIDYVALRTHSANSLLNWLID